MARLHHFFGPLLGHVVTSDFGIGQFHCSQTQFFFFFSFSGNKDELMIRLNVVLPQKSTQKNRPIFRPRAETQSLREMICEDGEGSTLESLASGYREWVALWHWSQINGVKIMNEKPPYLLNQSSLKRTSFTSEKK